MADSMWDTVKDFAYRHAPEWVQHRVDDNRAIARIEASLEEGANDARASPVTAQRQTQPDMVGVEDVPKRASWFEDYTRGTGMTPVNDDRQKGRGWDR